MSLLYPPRPDDVPSDIAAPSSRFTRHVLAAAVGLGLFLAVYFGLMAWFLTVAWRFGMSLAYGGDPVFALAMLVPAAFLALVLAMGLFFVRRGSPDGLIEVDPAEEPELVAFVHRVADDAGAPRPHRIYLSNRVNAAVFYDQSLLNLVFPSKKNLEIGLGLVNVLSLDEFKAVIAHEFGHFAQRSMRLGTWVYLTQQFVAALVHERTALDRTVDVIASIDLRVAWIGWILRLLVWSVRAVLDTAFRGVIYLERALSREMEFQADLVSVSVCGSDSLVHALHRLDAADDAWQRALSFLQMEAHNKRPVRDVFALQTRFLEHARTLRCDPEWGATPARPDGDAADHRVFSGAIADVPRMWSSHPPSVDREVNAKRRYVASPLDPRSPWALFADADGLRGSATRALNAMVEVEEAGDAAETADTLARIDAAFDRQHLRARYRSRYLDRDLGRHVRTPDELVGEVPEGRDAVLAALDGMYPEALGVLLETELELHEEEVQLGGLADGFLEAPGGVIRHRGEDLSLRDVPERLEATKVERRAALDAIHDHDRAVRAAHIGAARLVAPGWEPVLRGTLALVHYAEHAAADLQDASGKLDNVFTIVMADGSVSSSEMTRLTAACTEVVDSIDAIMDARGHVVLGPTLREAVDLESWKAAFPEEKGLFAPSRQELGSGWFGAMSSWVDLCTSRLRPLRSRALDELLALEERVEAAANSGEPLGDAPEAPRAPVEFARLVTGDERERQRKLGWWDSFVTAQGVGPATARFTVASLVLAPALFATTAFGTAEVVAWNGLDRPVSVVVGEQAALVEPHAAHVFTSVPLGTHTFAADVDGVPIDAAEVDIDVPNTTHVYNVARASAFVEWAAVYGSRGEREPRMVGPAHHFVTSVDHVFEDAPETVSSRSGGAVRWVLMALDDVPPAELLDVAPALPDAVAHLRWDDPTGPAFPQWAMVAGSEVAGAILAERADASPDDVMLQRLAMDAATEEGRASRCAVHGKRAAEAPDDPDRLYLALRCRDDDTTQEAIAAAGRFPGNPWLRWAAAYGAVHAGQWDVAKPMLDAAIADGSVPGVIDQAALWSLRLRRFAAGEALVDAADLASASPMIAFLLQLDDDDAAPPPDADPFIQDVWRLHRGDLKNAATSNATILTVLKGMSVGATPDDVAAALAHDPAELAPNFAPAMAALALRAGGDGAPAHADAYPAAFWEALTTGDVDALDGAVAGLSPELRGGARVGSLLRVGLDDAPPHWKTEAELLLFGNERPYWP